jgi:hypothetical protein
MNTAVSASSHLLLRGSGVEPRVGQLERTQLLAGKKLPPVCCPPMHAIQLMGLLLLQLLTLMVTFEVVALTATFSAHVAQLEQSRQPASEFRILLLHSPKLKRIRAAMKRRQRYFIVSWLVL